MMAGMEQMVFWVASAAGLVVAYLLGATPTGYLAGKLRGIDIRQHGSGSTGATNVLRTMGKWPALAVFVIDVLKGAVAVGFAGWFTAWLSSVAAPAGLELRSLLAWASCLAGLAALLGHSRSIWLGFTGGKSVATGLGVLLALSWPVGLGALAVFGVALAVFRIVSLSSMLAALAAIVLALALGQPLPYLLLVVAGGTYVIARHWTNIRRLVAGTEPQLGQAAPTPKTGP